MKKLFPPCLLFTLLFVSLVSVRSQTKESVSSWETFSFSNDAPLQLTSAKYVRPHSSEVSSLVSQGGSTATADPYVFPTAKQRARRYAKNMVGPFAFGRAALSAGIEQWNDEPEEWGQGAKGYGKRFSSNFGKNAIRQTVTYGLSEAFRLDTGFEKSKKKGFWPRLGDALIQNVTSRTRSGKRVLSAPIFVGTYAGAIIPYETWYPKRYSYKDGLRSGTYSLATGFGINVVREFVFNW
jgi:hypothetical protein